MKVAFGYEYWVVYLPEFSTDSFLLFVPNPAGSTKLRDYSGGRERVLGQPSLIYVRQATEWGRTRFEESPHTVSGPDGERYWQSRIAGYNVRIPRLGKNVGGVLVAEATSPVQTAQLKCAGRAIRGSQRQLQDYVNLTPSLLDAAIISALPAKTQQDLPVVRWVSPLASEQFREYRDADFMGVLGLGKFAKELCAFWPGYGPCWDALGILTTSLPGSLPISLLVEAKSHVQEIYGSGCQASETTRSLIQSSLDAAKAWCGADADSNWMGSIYQSANRIAHLYFFKQRLNRPCYLVNLFFVGDPYRPTSMDEWKTALTAVKRELGVTGEIPGLLEVFLPGRPVDDVPSCAPVEVEMGARMQDEACRPPLGGATASVSSSAASRAPLDESATFSAWCRSWETLGAFDGPFLPRADERIRRVMELWQEEIPGRWQRGIDSQLLSCRYRRSDVHAPHAGEHAIEHQILVERFGEVRLLGGTLIDGVNAFPLACDFAGGGRSGNVEADMLLAVRSESGDRLVLCEVKANANDPWYAAVELLRQMRLFRANPVGCAVMQKRGALSTGSAEIQVTGLVLALAGYYLAPGKKSNAVAPARRLFEYMRERFGVDLRLAVWEPTLSAICDL